MPFCVCCEKNVDSKDFAQYKNMTALRRMDCDDVCKACTRRNTNNHKSSLKFTYEMKTCIVENIDILRSKKNAEFRRKCILEKIISKSTFDRYCETGVFEYINSCMIKSKVRETHEVKLVHDVEPNYENIPCVLAEEKSKPTRLSNVFDESDIEPVRVYKPLFDD